MATMASRLDYKSYCSANPPSRSFSFQEFSQRYAVAVDALYPKLDVKTKRTVKILHDFSETCQALRQINMHFEDALALQECLLMLLKNALAQAILIQHTSVYVWHYPQLATLCRPAWRQRYTARAYANCSKYWWHPWRWSSYYCSRNVGLRLYIRGWPMYRHNEFYCCNCCTQIH